MSYFLEVIAHFFRFDARCVYVDDFIYYFWIVDIERAVYMYTQIK